MAHALVALRLPPVREMLPKGEGVAALGLINQPGSCMAAAPRIVVVLKDGLEAVEPADLTVAQRIGAQHLVGRTIHVLVVIARHQPHHRGALEELQEAELQHIGLQCIDIVEGAMEGRHALPRQADDEVYVQVDVARCQQAADMARYLLPVVHTRNGRQRLLIRRLDADLQLHAACGHRVQHFDDVLIEIVNGHLEMEVRAHRQWIGENMLQDG